VERGGGGPDYRSDAAGEGGVGVAGIEGPALGPASVIQLLYEAGIAEKGELKR
jgi:hypothetical protein